MKIIIVNEKDNPNMGRKELLIAVEHVAGATPSKAGLQQFLAKHFGIEPEQIEIKNIFSLLGRQQSKAKVFVWKEKRIAHSASKMRRELDDLSKPKAKIEEAKIEEEKTL